MHFFDIYMYTYMYLVYSQEQLPCREEWAQPRNGLGLGCEYSVNTMSSILVVLDVVAPRRNDGVPPAIASPEVFRPLPHGPTCGRYQRRPCCWLSLSRAPRAAASDEEGLETGPGSNQGALGIDKRGTPVSRNARTVGGAHIRRLP